MPGTNHKLNSVLIVDDDPILCVVTSSVFKNAGAGNIVVAENGLKALDIIDTSDAEFDFILCDLNMPCVDGVEFLRYLSERQFAGRVAILSGEDNSILKTAHQLAISHGLDLIASFNKPLNIQKFKETVTHAPSCTPANPNRQDIEYSYEDISAAIENGEIVPFYQPKVDVHTNKIAGSEALARWHHPEHGLVSPAQFIPLVEKHGLIDRMTRKLFERILKDAVHWKQSGIIINTSMNVATSSLKGLSLPRELSEMVARYGLLPKNFTLEITETGIMEKVTNALEVVTRLRIAGFGISIDDFGTGHSNLEQLRDFPFSEIKIDQSFIKQVKTDSFAQICVETGVRLARQLKLKLVAEGVEDAECWEYVKNAGIDVVQGYYIARPMSGAAFFDWLGSRQLALAS